MAGDPQGRRWRSVFIIGGFVYLSLMVAVVVGTLAAFGSRWAPTGLPPDTGDSASWLVFAALLLVVTLWLTRWLLRRTLQSRSTMGLAAIPVMITLLALLSLLPWVASGASLTEPTEPSALSTTRAETHAETYPETHAETHPEPYAKTYAETQDSAAKDAGDPALRSEAAEAR